MKNAFFGIRRNQAADPPNVKFTPFPLFTGIQGRSVTVPTDEPLCLSTLLGLETRVVAEIPPEQRIQRFWKLLSQSPLGIPSEMIFSSGPKLSANGYRWAPSAFLSGSRREMLQPQIYPDGTLGSEGLNVQFPGIHLSSISTINLDYWTRDTSQWYKKKSD